MKQSDTTSPGLDTPVTDLSRGDFVRLLDTETVEEALARLRGEPLGERVVYFYVTDGDGRLAGVVPVRRLLSGRPATRVADIMVRPVVSVPERATLGEALQLFNQRRLLALPVVDDRGRLRGVLDLLSYTHKALDFERHEAAEDLFQVVGIHVEHAGAGGVWSAFRRRFLWLPASIAGGIAAALLSGAFDDVLRQVVLLAFFIPIVLSVPESVAMQSVTLGLHRIQVSHLPLARDGQGLWGELKVGALLGLASGIIAGLVALLWLNRPQVGLVVAGAIWIGSAASAVVGLALPGVVHRANLDPVVASGPAVLALTDLMTLAVYFGLAAATLVG